MRKRYLAILILLLAGCKTGGSSLLKGIGPFPDTMTMLKSRFPEQTKQKHTYCRLCHEIPSQGTFKSYVEVETDRINPFTGKPFERIESICTSCHTSTHMAHPVGIIPNPEKVVLPPEARGFRGEENKLTCLGCHNQHPDNPNYKYLRWSTDGGQDKAKFCVRCHPKQGRNELQRMLDTEEKLSWRGVMLPSRSNPNIATPGYYYKPRQEMLGRDYRVSERFKANQSEKNYQLGLGLIAEGQMEKALNAMGKAVEQNPKHTEAFYEIGKIMVSRGQYELAIENFKMALEANPKFKAAHYELGEVYLTQKKPEPAVASFESAIAIDPKYSEAQRGLADAYLAMENPERALYLFDNALQTDPKNAEAYLGLGNTYLSMGKTDEAVKMFQKAIESRPNFYQAYFNLGECFFKAGELDKAQEAYHKAVKLRYNYAEAYYGLGKTYQKLGQYNDANSAFERALQLQPNYKDALAEIAAGYKSRGMCKEALEAYQKILQQDKNNDAAYLEMGKVHLINKNNKEATACFEKALQLNPNQAEAGFQLGKIYWSQKAWAKAETAFSDAVKIRDNYAEAHYYLGQVYQAQDELNAAIKSYQKALAQNPQFAKAYYNLGLAYRAQGKNQEADEAYYQAVKNYLGKDVNDADLQKRMEDPVTRHQILVEIDPENPQNHYNLGTVYMTEGSMDKAKEAFLKTVALDRGFWQAYYYLGLAANAAQSYGEAVSAYSRLLELKPEDKETHYFLGIAYKGQKDWDKAIEHFRQVLDSKPVQANYCLGQAYYEKWQTSKNQDYLKESYRYLEAALKENPNHEEAKSNLYVVDNLLAGKVEIILISSSKYAIMQDIFYALQGNMSRKELSKVVSAYPAKAENLFVQPEEFTKLLGHELDGLKDGQISKIIQNQRVYYIICRLTSLQP
ncbi:MAG: tetratricopeptide repeat protein [Candidatus Schekmanbacteria bacterium]|nr:tetratricopeptide repeat protein [Candidatus Schekmanbacteria bacterium]